MDDELKRKLAKAFRCEPIHLDTDGSLASVVQAGLAQWRKGNQPAKPIDMWEDVRRAIYCLPVPYDEIEIIE